MFCGYVVRTENAQIFECTFPPMPSLKKNKTDFMRLERMRERDKDRDGRKNEPQAAINSLTKPEICIPDERRHPKA